MLEERAARLAAVAAFAANSRTARRPHTAWELELGPAEVTRRTSLVLTRDSFCSHEGPCESCELRKTQLCEHMHGLALERSGQRST